MGIQSTWTQPRFVIVALLLSTNAVAMLCNIGVYFITPHLRCGVASAFEPPSTPSAAIGGHEQCGCTMVKNILARSVGAGSAKGVVELSLDCPVVWWSSS